MIVRRGSKETLRKGCQTFHLFINWRPSIHSPNRLCIWSWIASRKNFRAPETDSGQAFDRLISGLHRLFENNVYLNLFSTLRGATLFKDAEEGICSDRISPLTWNFLPLRQWVGPILVLRTLQTLRLDSSTDEKIRFPIFDQVLILVRYSPIRTQVNTVQSG